MGNIVQDPFLVHEQPPERWRPQQVFSAPLQAKATRDYAAEFWAWLGDGDPHRETWAGYLYVVLPVLLYAWVLLLWLVLKHFAPVLTVVATLALATAALTVTVIGAMGKRYGTISFLCLGPLCLLAVILGYLVGSSGWDSYARQYWWMQVGTDYTDTSASTAASSRADAAFVGFWDTATNNGTVAGSMVDAARSAGFQDGRTYCVAPILNPQLAGSQVIRVEYWAVGMDCCDLFGNFACDDARAYDGVHGVRMLERGFPCPGCNAHLFHKAVRKAEAMHGLISSRDHLFLRMVRSPEQMERWLLLRTLVFAMGCSLGVLLLFAALGWGLNFYGIARRLHNPFYRDASHLKLTE